MPTVETCEVVKLVFEKDGIYRIRLHSPGIAASVQPGQFIHLRFPLLESHLLRRPISVYNANVKEGTIELLFQEVGEGTHYLSIVPPGTRLDAIGPVGKGWQVPRGTKRALLVAGGVGIAPLNMLARELVKAAEVDLVVGAQSGDRLLFPSFSDWQLTIGAATNDGSEGVKGFATDLARDLLKQKKYDYIAACGPEPMLRIAAALSERHEVHCELSLERRMACGIGACLSCMVQTKAGARRACVDGPVFDSREVVW